MIGSGNAITIAGKKAQVNGAVTIFVGVAAIVDWLYNGAQGFAGKLGLCLMAFGLILWLHGKFQEWLGR